MAHKGYKRPTNAIAMGNPQIQELEVETATNMYPGRLVKKGTSEEDIVVGTDDSMNIGFLGYEQSNPEYKPTNRSTAYSAGDMAPVLSGGNFQVVANTDATVTKGQLLKGTTAGKLAAATVGTDHVVAKAEEDGSGNVLVTSFI